MTNVAQTVSNGSPIANAIEIENARAGTTDW